MKPHSTINVVTGQILGGANRIVDESGHELLMSSGNKSELGVFYRHDKGNDSDDNLPDDNGAEETINFG